MPFKFIICKIDVKVLKIYSNYFILLSNVKVYIHKKKNIIEILVIYNHSN